MPGLPLKTISDVQTYLRKAGAAAKHHGEPVQSVLTDLAGHILTRGSNIRVWPGRNASKFGLAMWAHFKHGRYAFSYDHASKTISIKQRSLAGPVLHSISDRTSRQQLAAIIAAL